MFLRLLLRNPFILLSIRHNLKYKTPGEEGEAEDICARQSRHRLSESYSRDGVQCQHWHEAQGDPCCLRKEGAKKLERLGADGIKAAVVAVAEDAGE